MKKVTINDVSKLANELMNKSFKFRTERGSYNLSASDIGYTFEFDNAKRIFGRCFYTRHKITISKGICEANLDKLNTQIKDTILHEIAHAFCVYAYGVKEGRGHGEKWRSIAKQIGSNGERCYSSSEVTPVLSKYSLVCDSCGRSVPKHRKPSVERACGVCCRKHNNGKFTPEFKMKLVLNK